MPWVVQLGHLNIPSLLGYGLDATALVRAQALLCFGSPPLLLRSRGGASSVYELARPKFAVSVQKRNPPRLQRAWVVWFFHGRKSRKELTGPQGSEGELTFVSL
jgi:hypothetical protein